MKDKYTTQRSRQRCHSKYFQLTCFSPKYFPSNYEHLDLQVWPQAHETLAMVSQTQVKSTTKSGLQFPAAMLKDTHTHTTLQGSRLQPWLHAHHGDLRCQALQVIVIWVIIRFPTATARAKSSRENKTSTVISLHLPALWSCLAKVSFYQINTQNKYKLKAILQNKN